MCYRNAADALPLMNTSQNSIAALNGVELPSSAWSSGRTAVSADEGRRMPLTRRLAPNLTRKSHKKSRAGCFNCKARKIKCDEGKPSCKRCIQKSGHCIYPTSDVVRENVVSRRSTSIPSPPSDCSETFSLQDMRFFHHFLTLAYPHLPLGNDSVWVKDIPQFAQEHSYLMHAMLALGASHLGRVNPDAKCESVALRHRGHAIAGLNRALAKNTHVYGEADAMLATCYTLTFQSSYMSDGMADFLTFVRGCSLAIGKIRDEGTKTAFDLRPNRHFQVVMPQLQKMPQVSPLLVAEGLDGIDNIRPLLYNAVELNFHTALRDVLLSLRKDAASGYIAFVQIYTGWCNLGHEDFTTFLDPNNFTSQILLAHFVGLQLIMVPLTAYEWPERAGLAPEQSLTGVMGWFREIEKRVPDELQHHLEWPGKVVEMCLAELSGLPFGGPSVLMLRSKQGPVAELG